jgi:hypothetical protein
MRTYRACFNSTALRHAFPIYLPRFARLRTSQTPYFERTSQTRLLAPLRSAGELGSAALRLVSGMIGEAKNSISFVYFTAAIG